MTLSLDCARNSVCADAVFLISPRFPSFPSTSAQSLPRPLIGGNLNLGQTGMQGCSGTPFIFPKLCCKASNRSLSEFRCLADKRSGKLNLCGSDARIQSGRLLAVNEDDSDKAFIPTEEQLMGLQFPQAGEEDGSQDEFAESVADNGTTSIVRVPPSPLALFSVMSMTPFATAMAAFGPLVPSAAGAGIFMPLQENRGQETAMVRVIRNIGGTGWVTFSGLEGPSFDMATSGDSTGLPVSSPLISKSPRRRKAVEFTCNKCGARTTRAINPLAYTDGTICVQCHGCGVFHKLVDNLNLFHELHGPIFGPAYGVPDFDYHEPFDPYAAPPGSGEVGGSPFSSNPQ
eukprot:TRINITY_DN3416_c0_g1_i1.p1 TRINITY_DN3416_c0_g1~~TRINITY_DN3416_c0_g1_i1.p1  ORF type:complete len:344 (-),score=47.05 TRINITY_DN3416_c0_g1_i1:548-1579(-)